MRSELIKHMGESLFISVYEFMRNCRSRELSDAEVTLTQITTQAQRRFGKNGKHVCFSVDKLVFLEDHAW